MAYGEGNQQAKQNDTPYDRKDKFREFFLKQRTEEQDDQNHHASVERHQYKGHIHSKV